MNILVLNCGSSSLKYQLINMEDESVIAKGLVERIGIEGSILTHKPTGKDKYVVEQPMKDHNIAVKLVLDALVDETHGVIKNADEIAAVGHRVLHAGEKYKESCLVNEDVKSVVRECFDLGPLHNPANLIGIEACEKAMPGKPNVAVFDTESRIPGEKMAKALNARLPEDIIIQGSKEVPLDYHPRFQDTRKTYEYTFYNARYDNPVTSRHHHFVYVPLDVEKMKKAASYFLGEHCFISMCSSKAQVTSYVREIYECNVTQNGRYITMRVTGSGFLYNMVRLMAGTLLEVGRGKKEPEWVKEILASKERVTPGPKLPAKGLTLIQIEYPEDRANAE